MRDRGFSLVEALVALSIILVMATVAFPAFRAHFADAHLVGAGRQRPALSIWPATRLRPRSA